MRLCFRAFDAVKLMTSGASPIDQMSGAVFSARPPRGTHSRQKSLNRFGASAAFFVFSALAPVSEGEWVAQSGPALPVPTYEAEMQ
jgi:hypothetical protein